MSSVSSPLDMATRTLDLTRSLTELSVKGNAVFETGGQLIRWLARDGISEREFSYCTHLMRAKAFPNATGLEIRSKLLRRRSKIAKLASLGLSIPGSVGHMMALDDDYCYIVTTVIGLMAFHDLSFAESCLCNFATDDNDHRHGPQYPYDIRKTRIKPVVSKIVESVALDIANSGFDLEELPPELQNLCRHVLDVDTFSAVIATLQRTQTNAWMFFDVFYADLVIWIFNHYSGVIEISIAGRIAFSEVLGQRPTKLAIIVERACDPTLPLHSEGRNDGHIKISISDGGLSKQVFSVDAEGDEVRGQFTPKSRRNLYDLTYINRPLVEGVFGQAILNKSELNDIGATSQAISRWLLKVSLKPIASFETDIGKAHNVLRGFTTAMTNPPLTTCNVGRILSHLPDILRHNFGELSAGLVTFREPEVAELDTEVEEFGPEIYEKHFAGITKVLECFPQVMTLFEKIRERCRRFGCDCCEENVDIGFCKPGCLGESALTALFTMISHVIADGFGVQSASGLADPRVIKWSIGKLLFEFAFRKIVLWDTWFAVASIVHLGCPWNEIKFETNRRLSGISCVSAVQYGSSLMVAKWTDMSAEQKLVGCFGADFAEGYHFNGLSDKFAIVQTEQTGWNNISDEVDGVTSENDCVESDDCAVQLETAIIGVTGFPYRLLTMVRSGNFLRIVDPAAALWHFLRADTPECSHWLDAKATSTPANSNTHTVWSLENLIGGWSSSWPQSSQVWVTNSLNSYLKVNIALCLSSYYSVIKDSHCCMQCAKGALLARTKDGDTHIWRAIICKDIEGRVMIQT